MESRGLELHGDLTSQDGGVQVFADAAFTEALKKNRSGANDPAHDQQIPYVPTASGSFGTSLGEGPFQFTMIQTYTGRRFTTSPAMSLSSFQRTDVNAAWLASSGDVRFRFRLEVSNVFGTDHEIFLIYPMPGRSAHASAAVEF